MGRINNMNRWIVLAAITFIFNKPAVLVEVGQVDESLRVSEGHFGPGGDSGAWKLVSADPAVAIVHRFSDDHFSIRGVSPGNTGIPSPDGGFFVRIKVVCGTEAPVIAEQPLIKARAGDTLQLRAVSDIAYRMTFQWYEGHSGDTSHPIAMAGAELTYTASAAPKQSVWVLASTPCGSSAAEFEIDVPPARTRAVRH